MLALLRDSWAAIQPDLRAKAGAAAYASWLQELRPLALERGTCYLEAKNRLTCERVQRLFAPILEESLSQEIGTRVTVQLTPRIDSLVPAELEVGPARPVVDDSNRTAFLVLTAMLEERELPARLFLFHGPQGAGKTFLLSWWRDRARPRPRVHDGLSLRKAFQVTVRDRRVAGLRQELCKDVPLVVDGVHRFAGYRRAQRELLSVLKARTDHTHPVLLASRWHPRDIWNLDRALETYLLSGFVTSLDLPGPAARLQYLRALAGAASRNGRAGAVESLAQQVQGGYLDLRRAWALERHGFASERHAGYLKLIDPGAVFRRVLQRVAGRLQLQDADLLGRSQRRQISLARQMLAYLCVQEGLSQAEVGRYLGKRSRAAISYCIKTLEQRMVTSAEIRAQVEALL